MTELELLEKSNTQILKDRVREYRGLIKPYEVNRGNHLSRFVDYVKRKRPTLDMEAATELFKAIISTWEGSAPKMFLVDHLEDFAQQILDFAREEMEQNPNQLTIEA